MRMIVLLAALAGTQPALAAQAAQTPAVVLAPALDPARVAAARRLIELLDVAAVMGGGLVEMENELRSGAGLSASLDRNPATRMERAKNPQAWDAAIKRIGAMQADAVRAIVEGVTPQVVEATIAIYARNFTVGDLDALIAFYQTPVGIKLRDRMPAISAESAKLVQTLVMPRVAEKMQSLQPKVQAELAPLMPR